MTRLLFATDFHGNLFGYEAFLDRAAAEAVDAAVLGGDLLPFPPRGGNRVEGQIRFVEEALGPLLRKFHAEYPSIRVFGILGNDDWSCCMPLLEALEPEGAFFPIHMRSLPLDATRRIAGYGCVPLTP